MELYWILNAKAKPNFEKILKSFWFGKFSLHTSSSDSQVHIVLFYYVKHQTNKNAHTSLKIHPLVSDASRSPSKELGGDSFRGSKIYYLFVGGFLTVPENLSERNTFLETKKPFWNSICLEWNGERGGGCPQITEFAASAYSHSSRSRLLTLSPWTKLVCTLRPA